MNWRKRLDSNGFTLIEIIVVLAIIAVLISIAIPTMSYLMDMSKERACAYSRSTMKRYLVYDTVGETDLSSEELQKLADSHSDIYCPSQRVSYTVALVDGEVVVTCPYHGSAEDKDGGSGMGDGVLPFDLKDALLKAVENAAPEYAQRIDSTAPDGEFTKKILEYWTQNGIDLQKSNIQSWCAVRTSPGANSPQYLYWTETDISQLNTGDSVLVMRYNSNLNTYTAGYVTVQKHSNTGYNIMNSDSFSEYRPSDGSVQTNDDKKNFSSIKNFYEKAKTE